MTFLNPKNSVIRAPAEEPMPIAILHKFNKEIYMNDSSSFQSNFAAKTYLT